VSLLLRASNFVGEAATVSAAVSSTLAFAAQRDPCLLLQALPRFVCARRGRRAGVRACALA
jgi:hypothetical protein